MRSHLVLLYVFSTLFLLNGCGFDLSKNGHLSNQYTSKCSASGSEAALDAFSQSIRPITLSRCVDCHATSQSPFFADANLKNAHTIIVPLLNGNPSVLESRAGDGHCGSDCENAASMKQAIQAYLAKAGGSCNSSSSSSSNTGNNTNTNSNTTQATAPTAPGDFAGAAASMTQINLSWQDLSSDEVGFRLQVSTNGSDYTDLNYPAANATTYSHTGLTAGTRYYYRIQSYNSAGSSAYQLVTLLTQAPLAVPAAPGVFAAAAASSSQINLSWQDLSSNETGFKLQVSADGATYIDLAMPTADATSYSHTGLMASTRYYYRLQSQNPAGASAFVMANVMTMAPPVVAPVAPANLTAVTASSSQINLSWQDVSNNETGFRVFLSTDGTTYSELATVGANVTSYASMGLMASKQYYYRVQSYNAVGASSNITANATTLAPPPAAPGPLTATAASSTQINLSWQDLSNNETGFKIQVSTNESTYTDLATVGANVTTYSHTSLTASTRYYYQVQSYNAVGGSSYVMANAMTNSDVMPGKLVYDNNCRGCHRLGTYDTSGGDPNLSGKEGKIPGKYTANKSGHKNITLSQQQINDLIAFVTFY